MIRSLEYLLRRIHGLAGDDAGGVAVYSAAVGLLALGAGALALDIGRTSVLRSQMQNRADAGALAGAAQLDGRAGAQARATAVAINATQQASGIPSDAAELSVQSVSFYSAVSPDRVDATGDEDSRFVEVSLNQRQVDYMLARFLSTDADDSGSVAARAVAGSSPFICHAPPLMICDPGEADPDLSPFLPANVGRQIQLKPPPKGGSAWAPGNYGLLALPDGSSGASDISAALAAVEPADCYNLDVSTATGVKTNKVKDGINARFDLPGGLPYPAPDVMNYPKDVEIVSDSTVVMGSGNWDIDGYWTTHHTGPLPDDLDGASRYQVYLYEQGLEYARNGKLTAYPVDGDVPDGYTLVTPPGVDIPADPADPHNPFVDGVPSTEVASNGPARRLVQIAVLQCEALDVKGSHTYPTSGNYIEGFVTQTVEDAPAGAIYVEILRSLTTSNDPDFHANVRLVE